MDRYDRDDEPRRRGVAASVREHGDVIALVGFGLILVSTRILSQGGHTPLSVGLIVAGALTLVSPVIASTVVRGRSDPPDRRG